MDNKMTEYILKHSRKKDKELKYDFMPSLLEIIERHIKYAVTFKGEQYGIRELRKHLAWYNRRSHHFKRKHTASRKPECCAVICKRVSKSH